ncbi:SHOCT domain-containing protein [Halosolutus amylolyticus]|uniref:SHOCT domain-containing protein n=1 Tax=Halosolutus amylolyticus TaxID=2932267 RepID=A0ABD5PTF9_9EURY|nr:SHOCT domain-containing protein [Halosolutus amylolyticus]
MASTRSSGRLSVPTVVVIVALLAAFVALALIDSGLAVIVAIVAFVFGGDVLRELVSGVTDDEFEADPEDPAADRDRTADALERLRTRYADGELSDDEFERKLETLLSTETLADVERHLETVPDESAQDDRELERSTE